MLSYCENRDTLALFDVNWRVGNVLKTCHFIPANLMCLKHVVVGRFPSLWHLVCFHLASQFEQVVRAALCCPIASISVSLRCISDQTKMITNLILRRLLAAREPVIKLDDDYLFFTELTNILVDTKEVQKDVSLSVVQLL